MMDQISRKTGNVAEFPLKLNLQLFAEDEEGYPNLEDSSEFRDDAKEFNAKMDKFAQEREAKREPVKETPAETVKAEEVVKPEVVDPEKPKQDPETNKAFQEMRQKLEAAEKEKVANEAKAKKADELITQQYGKSHGIYTVEQYEQRLQQEREQENIERYQAAGLTQEEIEAIKIAPQLRQETEAMKQERERAEWNSSWSQLYTAYPELEESSKLFSEEKKPEWFNDAMQAEIARGASPLAAYRNAHFETILKNSLQQTREVVKQEELNKLNSKNHIQANGTEGGDVEHVDIDDQTMRMYRALNKGKTDAQIRAWHKKNAM